MKNANMEKRIASLENRIGANTTATLHLEGGIAHRISASPSHFFALLDAAREQETSDRTGQAMPESDLSRELDWIRKAVRIDEDAHLIELLAALLAGPVKHGEINPD